MRKPLYLVVSLLFLGYGLIRLGVGGALLGQEIGLVDVPAFREPIRDIGAFLEKSGDKQIVPVSVAGYVSYIALMGLVLIVGALGAIKRRPFGLRFIGAFLLMYALLFVNFQTINPKAIHLGVCVILFCTLLWTGKGPGKASG
ncbi:MAG: hypothetical protein LKM32_02270 [Chiayiivirga sp.]|jgi:hypothetical protein|uniref:hypothetical protein n=1 Tax=Chiayiivirga sp. TaxID=2041042 RepID=UPI0025C1C76C|nr:hypothetical protein [Chiayiivirga sp.]MCI1710945.1 hypothetical protein [Chiayiivirga sp.]MCI1728260.1 hypothetical protein [Chiayiivirga sp.]